MRKISADYIFPIASSPIKNGVITIDDDGTILDVSGSSESRSQTSGIEYYPGIICPGFINTHCHLELSYLRSQITERAGMTGFIKEILSKRNNFTKEEIQKSIVKAEEEMLRNGIVAVGDISNDNSTFKQKAKGNLLYPTFLEIFNMNPALAEETMNEGLNLLKVYPLSNVSIVPHAPYTMSEKLLGLINNYASKNKSIITIHNQESAEENEYFVSQSGKMVEAFKGMGIKVENMRFTKKNSLQSTLPLIKGARKILLVHNTYTTKEDIQFAITTSKNVYFCTCPNANLFIENKLPDYSIFIDANVPMTIGTDSLASNWSLSILDEIKTITKYFPEIPLETLLTWATKNGAAFLDFNHLGTIEKRKKPGLNLLKNIPGLKITNSTEVEVLV